MEYNTVHKGEIENTIQNMKYAVHKYENAEQNINNAQRFKYSTKYKQRSSHR